MAGQGELDVHTQTHTFICVYICTHMFFPGDRNTVLNVFFFLYRFGTDMQMINFTTSEFQLTKACPDLVGCHL